MPWRETSPMEQRLDFVREWLCFSQVPRHVPFSEAMTGTRTACLTR